MWEVLSRIFTDCKTVSKSAHYMLIPTRVFIFPFLCLYQQLSWYSQEALGTPSLWQRIRGCSETLKVAGKSFGKLCV